jgi:hypothetical protein
MFDLPIASRCSIINIYCFTKIFYLDQFMPAPVEVVNRLQDSAIRAIWGKSKELVSKDLLLKPTKHGGFGLVPLAIRLACGRAKWIGQLLGPDWKLHRYLGARRRGLYQFIEQEKLKDKRTERFWFRQRGPYRRIDLGCAIHEWTWGALFHRRNDSVHYGWDMAFFLSKDSLPNRWKEYQEAWRNLVGAKISSSAEFKSKVLVRSSRSFDCEVDRSAFFVRGLEKEKVQSIGHLARKIIAQRDGILKPPWLEGVRWNERAGADFWRKLKSVRFLQPVEADTLHLYILGRLQRPVKWKLNAETHPNNQSDTCCMCLDGYKETLQHLFIECHVASLFMSELQVEVDAQSQEGLLRAHDPDFEHLTQVAKHVHYIYKLMMWRRLGKLPPRELYSSDIDKIVAFGLDSYHA